MVNVPQTAIPLGAWTGCSPNKLSPKRDMFAAILTSRDTVSVGSKTVYLEETSPPKYELALTLRRVSRRKHCSKMFLGAKTLDKSVFLGKVRLKPIEAESVFVFPCFDPSGSFCSFSFWGRCRPERATSRVGSARRLQPFCDRPAASGCFKGSRDYSPSPTSLATMTCVVRLTTSFVFAQLVQLCTA